MATDAEYWKARCLLERIAANEAGYFLAFDPVTMDDLRKQIRAGLREVRDDDFADDYYSIAYEVMDEDTDECIADAENGGCGCVGRRYPGAR